MLFGKMTALGVVSFTLAALLGTQPLLAADPVPQTVSTHHNGVFSGKRMAYDAVVEPFDIAGRAGHPDLRLVGISYLAHKAGNRPVLFAFNGGPIYASYGVHMGALGPKRVVIAEGKADPARARLADNPDSPLDCADIVLFDPAGTGFSRTKDGSPVDGYFSVDADAQQFADFVAAWLNRHHRDGSPVYIMGESYGTIRAPVAAAMLQKHGITPAGVILLGQAVNIIEYSQRPANIVSYVVSLPTLAALAVHYGKASTNGKSLADFLDEVYRFAGDSYLPALYQGRTLAPERRKAIAAQLAAYTGIPAEFYLANGLTITKNQFRRELLKDSHLVLAMSDGRYSAPADQKIDPAEGIDTSYFRLARQYLHQDLAIADSDSYAAMTEGTGHTDWSYGKAGTPFNDWPYDKPISELFAASPTFKLMVAGGYYDLQTSMGAARYLVERANWPADRVALHFYP
ncbi:MAG: hypothetical protein WCD42_10420, partial [Rhizomicrobium sp.]